MNQANTTQTTEVVKAIAPYLTALVAVVVSFLTGWLAHANWRKQFAAQYQQSILQERIRICQEVVDQLYRAHLGLAEGQLHQAFLGGIVRCAPEISAIGGDPSLWTRDLGQQVSGAYAAVKMFFKDTQRLGSVLSIYFGDEAVLAFYEVIKELQEASTPGDEYRIILEKTSASLKDLIEKVKAGEAPNLEAGLSDLYSQVQTISPETVSFNESMGRLISLLRKQILIPKAN